MPQIVQDSQVLRVMEYETMLTFIGLGLYDKTDVSEKGLVSIRNADHIFLENYTSRLMGTSYEGAQETLWKTRAPARP